MSQEENNSLENSQEIRDDSPEVSSGDEEIKVTVKEEIEETSASPQPEAEPVSNGEEKMEDKTDKVRISDIEIQSPIDAMIEKNNLDPPHPGDIAEQKATEKKWKRSRNRQYFL